MKLMAQVINLGIDDHTVSECLISGVYGAKNGVTMILADGITLGMNKDGGSSYRSYTIKLEVLQGIEIRVNEESGEVYCLEVSNHHP